MPVDIRIRFGRVVRRIREEQEINQEEAAERCGNEYQRLAGFSNFIQCMSMGRNTRGILSTIHVIGCGARKTEGAGSGAQEGVRGASVAARPEAWIETGA